MAANEDVRDPPGEHPGVAEVVDESWRAAGIRPEVHELGFN